MGKFFFPLLGVDFNELRQIALTLCHRIVSKNNRSAFRKTRVLNKKVSEKVYECSFDK